MKRHRRCQRLVGKACALFHRYMRLCGLFDYQARIVTAQGQPSTMRSADPVIIVANHPTLIDTTAMLAARPELCCLVAPWFAKNPLLYALLRLSGHIMLTGNTVQDHASALQAATGRLQQGQSLLIFPEGTRSPHNRLHPFKRGAFELALRCQVPLVPVAVRVDGRALDGQSPWYALPNTSIGYSLEMLEPLSPKDYPKGPGAAKQIAARVRNSLATAIAVRP